MPRLLRAAARALLAVLLLIGAAMAVALLPIGVRWPPRRESAIVELLRAEDAPANPTPHLEWR